MIDVLITSLRTNFVLEDQGPIMNYLGIHIEQDIDPATDFINSIRFTQVDLIDSILTNLSFLPNGQYPSSEQVKMHPTPMDKVLQPHPNAEEYPKTACAYHSIMGKLNFLAQST